MLLFLCLLMTQTKKHGLSPCPPHPILLFGQVWVEVGGCKKGGEKKRRKKRKKVDHLLLQMCC